MTEKTAPPNSAQLIEQLMTAHPKGYDLSLGRISRLLSALGNPQDAMPPIIHVAGTNGKGSTIAMMRAMLEANGLKVHVHSSPHLVSWHERYRIGANGGGQFVDDEKFSRAILRAKAANGEDVVTVFEILTAVMFLLFSENPADVALVEVGLGGRLDATNVIKNPLATVFTSISLDHQSYLGDRLELIASEKAGIIKPKRPVIVAEQPDAVLDVLERKARQMRSPVFIHGQHYSAQAENDRMAYQDEDSLLDLPLPRLAGLHQISNAATAIATLRQCNFNLPVEAIEQGLKNTYWPGRLQRLDQGNLVSMAGDETEIWLDGGHNPDAGTAAAIFMAGLEERAPKKLMLISAMLTTKDAGRYFSQFSDIASKVYTIPVASSDAGFAPDELANIVLKNGIPCQSEISLQNALRQARTDAGNEPLRILICGTLYLAGDALAQNGTAPR